MKPITTQRGMLERLTKNELLQFSKKNNVQQLKSETKTGIISSIMKNMTKSETINALKKFIKK